VGSRLIVRIVIKGSHRNSHESARFVHERQRGTALRAEHVSEAIRVPWLERPQKLLAARVPERIDLEEQV
jgi:hypothetical protein